MLAYSVGWPELLLILGVVLLLFGARKLPDIARSLGRSSQEFKRGLKEGREGEPTEQPAPGQQSREQPRAGAQPAAPSEPPPDGPPSTPQAPTR